MPGVHLVAMRCYHYVVIREYQCGMLERQCDMRPSIHAFYVTTYNALSRHLGLQVKVVKRSGRPNFVEKAMIS